MQRLLRSSRRRECKRHRGLLGDLRVVGGEVWLVAERSAAHKESLLLVAGMEDGERLVAAEHLGVYAHGKGRRADDAHLRLGQRA